MYWPNKKYCCFAIATSRQGSFSIIATTVSSVAEFKRRHKLTPVDTSVFFPIEYDSFARTMTSTYETYDNSEDAKHRVGEMLDMITDIMNEPYDYIDPVYESDSGEM